MTQHFNFFQTQSVFVRLALALGIALVSFMLTMIVSTVLAIPLFGLSFSELQTLGENIDGSNLGLLKYLQITQAFGLFVLPSVFVAYLYGNGVNKYLHTDKAPRISSVAMLIVLVVSSLPLINMMAELNASMHLPEALAGVEQWMRETEDRAQELTLLLLSTNSFADYMVNMLMIAVLPALGEELLFRGVIQRLMKEWTRNHHAAIWITATFFSLLHFQFLGFFPRLFLGALFGYLLVWSGSLWLPIGAHFLNNGIATTLMYLTSNEVVGEEVNTYGANPEQIVATSFFALVFVACLVFIYKNEIGNRQVALPELAEAEITDPRTSEFE